MQIKIYATCRTILRQFLSNFYATFYYYRYSISVFIVPLIVLIVTYTCICREIWKSAVGELNAPIRHYHQHQRLRSLNDNETNESQCHPNSSSRTPLISRAKINTVKQTIAVIVMYVVCSTPFILAQLWATWDPHASESSFANGKYILFLFDFFLR